MVRLNRLPVVILLGLILSFLYSRAAAQSRSPLDENILIAEQGNNRIIEVRPDKKVVWEYSFDNLLPSQGPSSAYFSPDHTKIIASLQNVIVIIDYASRKIVWQYGDWIQDGVGPEQLSGPQDAHILANGNIVVADTKNCRITIISPDKQIVNQYGQASQCVSKPNNYYFPNSATPISGGRFLITESIGSRITEVDVNGNELNSFKSPALYPSEAQLTPHHTLLVADYESDSAAIYELDQTATILWQYGPFKNGDAALSSPSFAQELPNGNIIVVDKYNHRVIVIDKATKNIVWQYGITGEASTLNLPTSVNWRHAPLPETDVAITGTPPAQTAVNTSPSENAIKLRNTLFAAQTALVGGDKAAATSKTTEAQRLYQQNLAQEFASTAPDLSSAINVDFNAALKAVSNSDSIQFTVVRSRIWAEILGASTTSTIQALQHKDGLNARTWLLLREFRKPTRISHPSADATLAVDEFLHGEQTAQEALLNVRSDLMDTYQSLLNESLIDADAAMSNGFMSKWVEQSVLAQGYWNILSTAYAERHDTVATHAAADAFSALVQAAIAKDADAFKQTRGQIETAMQGFQADPLYETRQAQHCDQFGRMLTMVSLEYGSGVYAGAIVDELDVQEAVGFHYAAVVYFGDMKPILGVGDVETITHSLDTLGVQLDTRVDSGEVDSTINHISATLEQALPSICQPISLN